MNWLYSPLQSYIKTSLSKYFSNVDLQNFGILSGDIVLRDLEFRLDALQEALSIPLSFVFSRGFIKELRIQIPWAHLFSRPIEIKISTIECILTARSGLQFKKLQLAYESKRSNSMDMQREAEAGEDTGLDSTTAASTTAAPPADEGRSESWLQDSFSAVLANASIEISNLVLKYEHANVVMSTSIRSIHIFSADPHDSWTAKYQVLQDRFRMLHKACTLDGLTVCLDRVQKDRSRTISGDSLNPSAAPASPLPKGSPHPHQSPSPSPFRRAKVTVFEVPILKRASIKIRGRFAMRLTAGASTSVPPVTAPKQRPSSLVPADSLRGSLSSASLMSKASSKHASSIRLDVEVDPFSGCECLHDLQPMSAGNTERVVALALELECEQMHFSISERQFIMLRDLGVLPDEDSDAESEADRQTAVVPSPPLPKAKPQAPQGEEQGEPASPGWGSWAWQVVTGGGEEARVDEVEEEMLRNATETLQASSAPVTQLQTTKTVTMISLVACRIPSASVSFLLLVDSPPSATPVYGTPSPSRFSFDSPHLRYGERGTIGTASRTKSRGVTKDKVVEILTLEVVGAVLELRSEAFTKTIRMDVRQITASQPLPAALSSSGSARHAVLSIGAAADQLTPLTHPADCWSWSLHLDELLDDNEASASSCAYANGGHDAAERSAVHAVRACFRLEGEEDDSGLIDGDGKKQPDSMDVAIGPVTASVDAQLVDGLRAFFGLDIDEQVDDGRQQKESAAHALKELAAEYKRLVQKRQNESPHLFELMLTASAVDLDVSGASAAAASPTFPSVHLSLTSVVGYMNRLLPSDEQKHLGRGLVCPARLRQLPSDNDLLDVSLHGSFASCAVHVGIDKLKRRREKVLGVRGLVVSNDLRFNSNRAFELVTNVKTGQVEAAVSLRQVDICLAVVQRFRNDGDVLTEARGGAEDLALSESLMAVRVEGRDVSMHMGILGTGADADIHLHARVGLCSVRTIGGQSGYALLAPFGPPSEGQTLDVKVHLAAPPIGLLLYFIPFERFWRSYCPPKLLTSTKTPGLSLHLQCAPTKVLWPALICIQEWVPKVKRRIRTGLRRPVRLDLTQMDEDIRLDYSGVGVEQGESQARRFSVMESLYNDRWRLQLRVIVASPTVVLSPVLTATLPQVEMDTVAGNDVASYAFTMKLFGSQVSLRDSLDGMDKVDMAVQLWLSFNYDDGALHIKRRVKADVSPVVVVVGKALVKEIVKIPGLFRQEQEGDGVSTKKQVVLQTQRDIERFDCVEVQFMKVSISFLPEKTARVKQLNDTIFHQPSIVQVVLRSASLEVRRDPTEKAMSLSVMDMECYESFEEHVGSFGGKRKGKGFTFAVWMAILSHLTTKDIGRVVTAFGVPLVPPDALRVHIVEQLVAKNPVYWLRTKESVAQELAKTCRETSVRKPGADLAGMSPLFCSAKARKQHMLLSILAKDSSTSSFLHLTSQSAQVIVRNVTILAILSLLTPLSRAMQPSTSATAAHKRRAPKHFRIILNTRPITLFFPASQPLPLLQTNHATLSAAGFICVEVSGATADVDSRPRGLEINQVVQPPSVRVSVGHFEMGNGSGSSAIARFVGSLWAGGKAVEFVEESEVVLVDLESKCGWKPEEQPMFCAKLERLFVQVENRKTWKYLVNAYDLVTLTDPLFWHLLRDSFLDPALISPLNASSPQRSNKDPIYHSVAFEFSLGECNVAVGDVLQVNVVDLLCRGDFHAGEAEIGQVSVDGVDKTELFRVVRNEGEKVGGKDIRVRWRTDAETLDKEAVVEMGGEARSWVTQRAVVDVIAFLDVQYQRLLLPITLQAAKEMVVIRRKARAKKMARVEHAVKMKMVIPSSYSTFLMDSGMCLVARTHELFFSTTTRHVQESDGIFVRMELFLGNTLNGLEEWMPECTVKMSSQLSLVPFSFGVQMDLPAMRFRVTPETGGILDAVGQGMFFPMYSFYYMSYVTGSTPRLGGVSYLYTHSSEGVWEDLSKTELEEASNAGPVVALKDVWRHECCDVLQEAEVYVHTSPRRPTCVNTNRTISWCYSLPALVKEVAYVRNIPVPWLRLDAPIGLNIGLSYWDDLRGCFVLVHAFLVTLGSSIQMDTNQDSTTLAFADAFNSMVDATIGAPPAGSSSHTRGTQAPRKVIISDLARVDPSTRWCLHWTAASPSRDPSQFSLSDARVNELLQNAVSVRVALCDSYVPVFHVSVEAESIRAGLVLDKVSDGHGHEIVALHAAGVKYVYRKHRNRGADVASTTHRVSATVSVSCQNFTNLSRVDCIRPAEFTVFSHTDVTGARAVDLVAEHVHCNVEHTLVLTLHQAMMAAKVTVGDTANPRSAPGRGIRIMVHNNTGCRLFLGQYATSESVAVAIGDQLAYSWRVPSAEPSMRFALGEEEAGSWSRPLSLDTYGVFARVMDLEDRQVKVWVVIQGGNNGLQTLVRVQSAVKVINFSPLPLMIEVAQTRQELPASESRPAYVSFREEKGDAPLAAPATVQKEAPLGLINDERIYLHEAAQTGAVDICTERVNSDEVRVSLRLQGAASWTPSTLILADKPTLMELMGDSPEHPTTWLWVIFHPVRLRKVHLGKPENAAPVPVTAAWSTVELWPLIYIRNGTASSLSMKVRLEKRWESLEFAMQQRPETDGIEDVLHWPAVFQSQETGQIGDVAGSTDPQGASNPSAIEGDEETKTLLRHKYMARRPSERRQSREDAHIEPGDEDVVAVIGAFDTGKLGFNPNKAHILFVGDERLESWSEPGLRLQSSLLFNGARRGWDRSGPSDAKADVIHERHVSCKSGVVIVQARTTPMIPAVTIEVKPRVMVKNESNQRVYVHCRTEHVECHAGGSQALPFADVQHHGVALSLDGDLNGSSKTKTLRLDEAETQFVALPMPQLCASSVQDDNGESSGAWLVLLACIIERQETSSAITITVRNRVLLHNKTGLPNLRIRIVSSMASHGHFLWEKSKSLAPLSFYHDVADAEEAVESKTATPPVSRGGSGLFGFLWNKKADDQAVPLQAEESVGLCPETSKPELRTGFALCIVSDEGMEEIAWSCQVLIPSLIKQEKLLWQRLFVPNVDAGRAELFGCSMCEEEGTIHVAVHHDKQPAFVLRSELEDETLYFKLGNSLGTNYSKRVLKIPPRAIAAFDPAMLGVTGNIGESSTPSAASPSRLRRQPSMPLIEVDRTETDYGSLQSLQSKVFDRSETLTFHIGSDQAQIEVGQVDGDDRGLRVKYPGLAVDSGQIQWSRPVVQTAGRCTLPLQSSEDRATLVDLHIVEAQGCNMIRVSTHVKGLEEPSNDEQTTKISRKTKVRVRVQEASFSAFEDGVELFYGCINGLDSMYFDATQVRKGGFHTIAQACSRKEVTLTKRAFITHASAVQLSSFLEDAEFPLILDVKAENPSATGAKVAIKFVDSGPHFSPFAESVHVELAPCFVVVEDLVIARAIALATKLLAQLNAQHKSFISEDEGEKRGESPSMQEEDGDVDLKALMLVDVGLGENSTLPEALSHAEKPYVFIGSLHVSKLEFELTLRNSSMPMFVGIDDTLVRFTQLDVMQVFATKELLVKELLANYLADALLNSPALIGSLEIIGNPTGFIRAISSGMWDLVALPMEEMQHGFGPGALLRGVARGWLSWFKHVSHGALSSVSGFSHSVARNLDKLSLDQDYINRRRRLNIWTNKWANNAPGRGPSNALARGITHGLMGLSQGVLGAATGMISLPLTTAQTDNWRLRSVVAGIGKGLAGVVLKPVSGAADLVAQTSDGIMNQVGMGSIHKHLPVRTVQRRLEWRINSVLRLDWKILPQGEKCACFARAVWVGSETDSTEENGVEEGEVVVEVVLTAKFLRVYVVGDGERSHQDLCLHVTIPWDTLVLHESIATDNELKVQALFDSDTEQTSIESEEVDQVVTEEANDEAIVHLRFESAIERKEVAKYASLRCRQRTSY